MQHQHGRSLRPASWSVAQSLWARRILAAVHCPQPTAHGGPKKQAQGQPKALRRTHNHPPPHERPRGTQSSTHVPRLNPLFSFILPLLKKPSSGSGQRAAAALLLVADPSSRCRSVCCPLFMLACYVRSRRQRACGAPAHVFLRCRKKGRWDHLLLIVLRTYSSSVARCCDCSAISAGCSWSTRPLGLPAAAAATMPKTRSTRKHPHGHTLAYCLPTSPHLP